MAFPTGMDAHTAAHFASPLTGVDAHLMMTQPWMVMCAIPIGWNDDGSVNVDMVLAPSSVDHFEALAQMCEKAAERLRAAIRLDIPDYPPL